MQFWEHFHAKLTMKPSAILLVSFYCNFYRSLLSISLPQTTNILISQATNTTQLLSIHLTSHHEIFVFKNQKFIQKIMQASNNKAVQFSKVFHACFEASFLLQFSATMTFSSYAANKNPNKQQTFKPKQHFMHLIIKTHPYTMHSLGFTNLDHTQRQPKNSHEL